MTPLGGMQSRVVDTTTTSSHGATPTPSALEADQQSSERHTIMTMRISTETAHRGVHWGILYELCYALHVKESGTMRLVTLAGRETGECRIPNKCHDSHTEAGTMPLVAAKARAHAKVADSRLAELIRAVRG